MTSRDLLYHSLRMSDGVTQETSESTDLEFLRAKGRSWKKRFPERLVEIVSVYSEKLEDIS